MYELLDIYIYKGCLAGEIENASKREPGEPVVEPTETVVESKKRKLGTQPPLNRFRGHRSLTRS